MWQSIQGIIRRVKIFRRGYSGFPNRVLPGALIEVYVLSVPGMNVSFRKTTYARKSRLIAWAMECWSPRLVVAVFEISFSHLAQQFTDRAEI
jgi:hypothetical protein